MPSCPPVCTRVGCIYSHRTSPRFHGHCCNACNSGESRHTRNCTGYGQPIAFAPFVCVTAHCPHRRVDGAVRQHGFCCNGCKHNRAHTHNCSGYVPEAFALGPSQCNNGLTNVVSADEHGEGWHSARHWGSSSQACGRSADERGEGWHNPGQWWSSSHASWRTADEPREGWHSASHWGSSSAAGWRSADESGEDWHSAGHWGVSGYDSSRLCHPAPEDDGGFRPLRPRVRLSVLEYVRDLTSQYGLEMSVAAQQAWKRFEDRLTSNTPNPACRLLHLEPHAQDSIPPRFHESHVDVAVAGVNGFSPLYRLRDVTGVDERVQAAVACQDATAPCLLEALERIEENGMREFSFVCRGATHRSVACCLLLANIAYPEARVYMTTKRTREAAAQAEKAWCGELRTHWLSTRD
jgi:hypothetical protein